MVSDNELRKKIKLILPHLNEQAARLYLGSEAQILGRGGKQRVAKLAGVSRVRVDKGIAELAAGKIMKEDNSLQKIRKTSGAENNIGKARLV